MRYRIEVFCRCLVFLITILSSPKVTHSQSLTPTALNNGGGTGLGMEWSMCESVSIAYFSTPNLFLTTGVLQPNTSIVTGLSEFGPSVFGNEIKMGPIPVIDKLFIKADFKQMGNLSFQIMDAQSALLKTIEAGTIFSSYEKELELGSYTSGIFYIRVIFTSVKGSLKSGIYKIIKL